MSFIQSLLTRLSGTKPAQDESPEAKRIAELTAEVDKFRKEAACRQLIGNVIARYFIKKERTSDISIGFSTLRPDSDPVWMTGVLERTTLTEPEFAIFRFFNDDTDTVLDIGANYGYSAATIWAAGATSKILSFEPNPWHVVCLEQIKQMRPGIFDFVNIALGSSPGELNFVLPVIEGTGVSGLMSASIESEMDWAIPENVLLYMVNYLPNVALPRLQFTEMTWEVAQLDTVLAGRSFDVPTDAISAIKMDVEGFEADVVAGAVNTLHRHKPLVMLEGANRDPDVVRQMTALGYRYADFNGDTLNLMTRASTRTSGFFLHDSRLQQYRDKGLLTS